MLILSAVLAIVLLSCSTVPSEIDPELSQAELIQNAQEAVDEENYDAAIAYYQAVAERFPDDLEALATARYETAFIYYKRGDMERARAGFVELLGMYDMHSEPIPEWPRVLATTLLEMMDQE